MDALELKEINGLEQQLAGKVNTADPRLSDPRTPTAHQHDDRYYTEPEVDDKLAGKVDTTDPRLSDARNPLPHTHLSSTIPDFAEAVQDAVAAFMRAGANVTVQYDDASNTYTISSAPGDVFDPERTRDAIGAALIGVGNVSVAINDEGDTIVISTTATQNSPDVQLRDRATHTGTQAIDTVEGLRTALQNKTNNATTAALSGRVSLLENLVLESDRLNADKQGWAGLSVLEAVYRLINEGSGSGPTNPTTPAANGYVSAGYVSAGYVSTP